RRDLSLGPRKPIHLGRVPGALRGAPREAVDGEDRRVLGQRARRIVLRDLQARADRAPVMADAGSHTNRDGSLDRSRLQPAASSLVHRHDEPGRLRGPILESPRSGLTQVFARSEQDQLPFVSLLVPSGHVTLNHEASDRSAPVKSAFVQSVRSNTASSKAKKCNCVRFPAVKSLSMKPPPSLSDLCRSTYR